VINADNTPFQSPEPTIDLASVDRILTCYICGAEREVFEVKLKSTERTSRVEKVADGGRFDYEKQRRFDIDSFHYLAYPSEFPNIIL
jgi:hypothetical protein